MNNPPRSRATRRELHKRHSFLYLLVLLISHSLNMTGKLFNYLKEIIYIFLKLISYFFRSLDLLLIFNDTHLLKYFFNATRRISPDIAELQLSYFSALRVYIIFSRYKRTFSDKFLPYNILYKKASFTLFILFIFCNNTNVLHACCTLYAK